MVGIVKWLRHRIVAPVCVGSNPTTHPIFKYFDMGFLYGADYVAT